MSKEENVNDDALTKLAAAVEHALRLSSGEQISVIGANALTKEGRRNLVARLSIEGTNQYTTVIAKRQSPAPGSEIEYREGPPLLRELAALEFLNALPRRHAPTLYASDVAENLIIMEDLGEAKASVVIDGEEWNVDSSLVQPLMGGTKATAESGLVRFARCLGQMHADAAGRHDRFRSVCDRLHIPEAGIRSYRAAQIENGLMQARELLSRLGMDIAPALRQELIGLTQRLQYPGHFNTLIHGDPCPDNCTYIDDQLRIIDFEFAHFGHAFLDASYFRAAFPSCWCCLRVPSQTVERAETAYRKELVQGIPAIEDDTVFHDGLHDGCVAWALTSLPRLGKLLEEDEVWGVSSVRARTLYRLSLVSEISTQRWSATADFCGNLFKTLSGIWGDQETLYPYPAFAKSP